MESSYQFSFGGGLWGAGGASDLIKDTGVFNETPSSVKQYACAEDYNQKYRANMEDTFAAIDKFAGDANCGCFGVFDGHGGKTVSEHVGERLPEVVRKEMLTQPQDLVVPLESAFDKLDKECKLIDAENTGTTACITIIRNEGGHKVLYVANVGDTRCVLSRSGKAERMSYDHRATDYAEIDRIKLAGGIVMQDRVAGSLAITRAFGDHSLRKHGVTAEPSVKKYVIKPFDKYIIIASDGVWDTLEDQDCVDLIEDSKNCQENARKIVRTSIEKGSKDNICCIVVQIQ